VAHLLLAWGGLVGVLMLASIWQGVGLWQLADGRADREAHLRTVTATNAGLAAEVRSEPAPELVSEVDALRDEFRLQSRLMDVVSRYHETDQTGFSGYLSDLAAQHVDGVALDRIELAGGGQVLLSGEAEAAVHVPRLLKRLADGRRFRGHRFDEFRLEAQPSGLLRFDIVGPAEESGG
jgi:hypothetical protein